MNYMDNFLLLNLKTMFEHHVEDSVWKNQQGLVKVLNWKLYDSCGVHCVTMQSILYYLLVEKMYPLTNHTLHQMFNDVKLQVDYECEMAFELLRLLLMKKLKILKKNIKFRGGLLGLKAFLKLLLLRTQTKLLEFSRFVRRINIIPTKEDLDDLFSPFYEEYYETRQPEVSTNSATPTTLNNEDTPSSSTIVVDDNEAPQIESTSEEPTS
ncbi:hypothetical protein Tco_0251680 [Tanacetum coccineum]